MEKNSDRRLVGTTIDFFFVKTIILICIEQKKEHIWRELGDGKRILKTLFRTRGD